MSEPGLLTRERQNMIRAQLVRDGRVDAQALSRQFSVSNDTIRRDLRALSAAGVCERVYGGALALPAADVPLSVRMGIAPDRKAALAQAAVRAIRPGSSVFLDAGSTNLAIAQALPRERALKVATNAPAIAAALGDHAGIDLVMIGGQVERSVGGVVDGQALREAEALIPDLMVLGACGLDLEAGITAARYDDAAFKRSVAMRSRAVLAAVTREKIGAPHAFAVMPLSARLTIVVEHDTPADACAAIAATGATVIVADRAPGVAQAGGKDDPHA